MRVIRKYMIALVLIAILIGFNQAVPAETMPVESVPAISDIPAEPEPVWIAPVVVEPVIRFDIVPIYSIDTIASMSMEEFVLMARCVEAEAGGEDFTGQYMVAQVIFNRIMDPNYPDTVTEVITQRYQFTSWSNGMIAKAEPTDSVYEAVQLATEVMELPKDVIFFSSEGYQTDYGIPWKRHGGHYFSRKKVNS